MYEFDDDILYYEFCSIALLMYLLCPVSLFTFKNGETVRCDCGGCANDNDISTDVTNFQ